MQVVPLPPLVPLPRRLLTQEVLPEAVEEMQQRERAAVMRESEQVREAERAVRQPERRLEEVEARAGRQEARVIPDPVEGTPSKDAEGQSPATESGRGRT